MELKRELRPIASVYKIRVDVRVQSSSRRSKLLWYSLLFPLTALSIPRRRSTPLRPITSIASITTYRSQHPSRVSSFCSKKYFLFRWYHRRLWIRRWEFKTGIFHRELCSLKDLWTAYGSLRIVWLNSNSFETLSTTNEFRYKRYLVFSKMNRLVLERWLEYFWHKSFSQTRR